MDNQNGTTDLLEEFAASIEQLAHTIEGIARLEEEKAETASLGYHDRMDGILKREQVYILKLRGLEQKRLRNAVWSKAKGQNLLSIQDLSGRNDLSGNCSYPRSGPTTVSRRSRE